MRDEEIAAAIVAGDPDQLGHAYDRYAPSLYAYCQSRLNDPVRAADAVKDTFVVAAAKLTVLRDRSRLRAWLYAVARNECRHRLDGPDVARAHEAVLGDETMDFGTALEQAERRELVWSALAGLSLADRDIVELSLRHDLHGADLADVLGVPPSRAEVLDDSARQRFETALGALLMARSGEGSCPELSEILAGWDQELTDSVSSQVRQHITSCPACQDARRHEVDPVAALRVLPVAVLPGSLRYELLQLLTDQSPEASQYCVAVATRAEPFSRWGFPVPLDSPGAGRARPRLMPLAGALALVLLVLGGGAALAAREMHHSAGPALPAATSAAPSPHAGTATAGHGKKGKRARTGAGAGGPASAPAAGRSSTAARPVKTARASAHATTAKPAKSKKPSAHPTTPKPSPTTPKPSPTTPKPTTPAPTTPAPTTPAPTITVTAGLPGGLLSSFASRLLAL